MRIASVDLFYLAMPSITSDADGTQDTVLVRIREEGGLEGWGECDASPLVTIAAYVCPRSHGNINPLRDLLVGESLENQYDIRRIRTRVLREALDIEHVHHALSGADIALWDLLGKKLREPVWRLLDGRSARSFPKVPYASVLFEDTPDATRERARGLRAEGFQAAKFGWGPMGKHGEAFDIALVEAGRMGLGPGATLLIDAGTVWGEDHETALARAIAFEPFEIGWLEEPLLPDAVSAYASLQEAGPPVDIAAGEGASRFRAAEDIILNGAIDVVQIDAGRIGGITTAHDVRLLAAAQGIRYVNHTFKSHLSLAAALHVFASAQDFDLCEYPAGGSELSRKLVRNPITRRKDGLVATPSEPGLGVEIDLDIVRRFLKPVRIEVGGGAIHETPPP